MERLQEMMNEFCDILNLKDPDDAFCQELTQVLTGIPADDIKKALQQTYGFGGWKPLNWAAKQGHGSIITAFLTAVPQEYRLKLLLQTNKYTALHSACRQVKIVNIILSHLTSDQKVKLICSQSRNGSTPLHETVNWGKTDIAKIYLDNLSPDEQLMLIAAADKDGLTVAKIADSKDDMVMEELLEEYQEKAEQKIKLAETKYGSDKSKSSEEQGKAIQTKEGLAAGISESVQNLKFTPPEDPAKTIPFFGKKFEDELEGKLLRCLIPSERVTLGKRLGKGNFGVVYKGQLITPSGNLKTVAVKSIRDEKEISFEDVSDFIKEGLVMIDFKHANVLSLIGVVYERKDLPLVVLPYMENGDLCSFIRQTDVDLVMADLLHFGYQIANGMAYLAERKFVHRDLAARNCMIDCSYLVKIADFGMSRDIYEKDYYKMEDQTKPVPMKWMALESLKEGKYTTNSDVWSFGVTMWELLTRGSSPYPGVSNYYVKDYVDSGLRLDRPSSCPPIIYEMMMRCWTEKPENRPTFDELSQFIGQLLNGHTLPSAGSRYEDGYSYQRMITKDITQDYQINNQYHDYDNIISAQTVWDVYITPESSSN